MNKLGLLFGAFSVLFFSEELFAQKNSTLDTPKEIIVYGSGGYRNNTLCPDPGQSTCGKIILRTTDSKDENIANIDLRKEQFGIVLTENKPVGFIFTPQEVSDKTATFTLLDKDAQEILRKEISIDEHNNFVFLLPEEYFRNGTIFANVVYAGKNAAKMIELK